MNRYMYKLLTSQVGICPHGGLLVRGLVVYLQAEPTKSPMLISNIDNTIISLLVLSAGLHEMYVKWSVNTIHVLTYLSHVLTIT